MKKIFLPLVLALCLLLAACGDNYTDNQTNNATANQTETDLPDISTDSGEGEDTDEESPQSPAELGMLTVEVVVDSEDADSFLSQLNDLSALLDQELKANGYDAETVTITISTAGGTTADALATGGVDIALMPAEDFISCEDSTIGILMDDGEVPKIVAVVTTTNAELDSAFQDALTIALTDGGEESFLSLCYPGTSFISFDSTKLQPIRDRLAEEASSAH